jgi:hypothetical protein
VVVRRLSWHERAAFANRLFFRTGRHLYGLQRCGMQVALFLEESLPLDHRTDAAAKKIDSFHARTASGNSDAERA